jgi:hypothetical protein
MHVAARKRSQLRVRVCGCQFSPRLSWAPPRNLTIAHRVLEYVPSALIPSLARQLVILTYRFRQVRSGSVPVYQWHHGSFELL